MILVTGSAGYIGSQITEYFEKNNINYIGIDNFLYSIPANITNKKRFIKTDFNDSKKITKIIVTKKVKLRKSPLIYFFEKKVIK